MGNPSPNASLCFTPHSLQIRPQINEGVLWDSSVIDHDGPAVKTKVGRCCSLVEQRPEPAPWFEGVANWALVIFLVSMPKGHSWGQDKLSALLHCLPLHPSAWKKNKMFLINSRALTLLPFMVRWSNSPVFPNDLMWLLPIKVQAERSHFVFLLWRTGGPPDSPIAKLYVCLFITPCPRFRSFSPTMLDTAPSKCWFFLSFFFFFVPAGRYLLQDTSVPLLTEAILWVLQTLGMKIHKTSYSQKDIKENVDSNNKCQ